MHKFKENDIVVIISCLYNWKTKYDENKAEGMLEKLTGSDVYRLNDRVEHSIGENRTRINYCDYNLRLATKEEAKLYKKDKNIRVSLLTPLEMIVEDIRKEVNGK